VVTPAGGGAIVSITEQPAELNFLNRRRLDWGDAPDTTAALGYPTLAVHGGARHQVLSGYSLGKRIDPEPDGQPNANATGDDLGAPGDDEDGVAFLTPLTAGSPATVRVDFTSTMGLTGVLDAWLDFNADGDWDDAGERIFATQALAAGANFLSFLVPAGATPGPTFARFRLSPNGVSLPGGFGVSSRTPLHGEVEDYQVRLEGGQQQLDWGDAPDSPNVAIYPTLAVHNGARHEILANFSLGPNIDPEANGQPDANATGDDTAGVDDENGIVLLTPLVPGNAAQVQVNLNSAGGGFLSAWIDYAGDGSWAGAGDQVFNGVPLVPGANVLNFNVPAAATAGFTFARFRLAQTPSAIATYDGFGGRGEVEDYRFRIDPPPGETGELDWGDAPDIPGTILQYPTLAIHNGARHKLLAGLMLGGKIDAEPNGQPTILADGDDANTSDDEDGVTFLDPLIPGQPARIQIDLQSPTGQGRLDAWIDWYADGNWLQAVDRIATAALLVNGPNIIVVNVPLNAASGRTFARFRLSLQGNHPFEGYGREGEVEDYVVEIRNRKNRKLDWGDAPQSAAGAVFNYPTTAAVNGARHVLRPGFYLGLGVDAELDGQPTIDALGDDNNGVPDDEDGVKFLSPIVPGGIAQIQVVAPLGGVLDAWIDFYRNGQWLEPPERIATTHPLAPGLNILNIPVPPDSVPGETYARFRLSPNGVVSFDGFGFEGEVEDYRIKIEPPGEFDWGDARKNYPTIAADDGAHHSILPGFTLGNLIDAEPDGQPSAGADRDDLVGIDDEDGVTLPGGFLTAGANNAFSIVAPSGGVLDAWMDLNIDGDWDDPGEHFFSAVPLAAGLNNLFYFVPAGTSSGDTYARFRLTRDGIATYKGFSAAGEVEDYLFTVRNPDPPNGPFDWGDAPDSPNGLLYPTLAIHNGARHTQVPGFTLGRLWDAEPDGQPSPDSLRDDFAGIDDEDGVQFLSPILSGGILKLAVLAPGGGMLDAWIDWDADVDWTDANDQIFDDQPLAVGMNFFAVPVPGGLKPDPYRAFTRFRLSREGVASFTGNGGDGEVEDYRVIISGPSATLDPATGILHVAGTSGADHLFFDYDAKMDLIKLNLLEPPDPDMPDFLFESAEVMGVNFDLGAGDDQLMMGNGVVDAADYVVWRKNLGADGGPGMDELMLSAAGHTGGVNSVFGPMDIQFGPLDLMHSNFDAIAFDGGMGDDMILIAGLGGPDTSPSLTLGGGLGNDSFYAFGTNSRLPAVQIAGGSQPAGGPGDSLFLFGDGSVRFTYTPASGMPDAGMIVGLNPQPEVPSIISFTGLEPVSIAGGSVTLALPPGVSGNDQIAIDPLSLPTGDSNMISGTSSGGAFEHLVITDVSSFTLDVVGNGAAVADVVDVNGSIIGADTFTMPAGTNYLRLNVNAGSIPIGWDPGALGAPVDVNIAGGAEVRFGVSQHLALLSLQGGAISSLADGGNKVLVTDDLIINAGGSLDLFDNDLIVDYSAVSPVGVWTGSQYDGVTGYIDSGRLNSSSAVGVLKTLGVAEAREALNLIGSQTGTFAGEVVDSTAVLVKFTWGGDANIDGKINIDDYGRIDGNVAQSGVVFGWFNGDFNLDGKINIDDYGIIDGNINQQDEIL
jgi:cytoskeletal protein CcmA (bactofilin family)